MSITQKMMSMSATEVELFYEEVITFYAADQYKSLHESYKLTQQISTLNLSYLGLHKNRDSPQQANTMTSQTAADVVELTVDTKPYLTGFAQRHYERAVEYTKQNKWAIAVQELRDAIKLDPSNSEYYALLGVVHLRQNFPGMARVYIGQALKLNPQQPLALKYAKAVNIQPGEKTSPQAMAKALGLAALLGKFLSDKRP